jgi:hypothetical protein
MNAFVPTSLDAFAPLITPYAPSLRLLRAFYAPSTLHECSSPCNLFPDFVPVTRICTFQLCTERSLPAPVGMVPSGSQVASHPVPKHHGHKGSGRFRDPTPASSNSDQDVGFGGSAQKMPRHQLPAPRPQTSRQRVSPEATDEEPETPVCSRSARDLPDGRWQRADSDGARPEVTPVREATPARSRAQRRADSRRRADSGIAHCRKHQAIIHDVDYMTSKKDCQISNETDEDPSKFSSSDHRGHDNRQPKCRSSAKYFGASEWTTKEWKILRSSDNISDPDKASDDDRKPCFHTKPSRRKSKWSSNLGQSQGRHQHAPRPGASTGVQVF